jgi:transcriptional regulator GlxA family with amidase domain
MDVDQRVAAVLARVDAEWRKGLRVSELAASVNLGASRLTHLVRVHAQTSIRELVLRRRMSEAARLLTTTFYRVSEISYHVGFTDACNFTHVFHREFGVSPRAYRERAQRERDREAEAGKCQDATRRKL